MSEPKNEKVLRLKGDLRMLNAVKRYYETALDDKSFNETMDYHEAKLVECHTEISRWAKARMEAPTKLKDLNRRISNAKLSISATENKPSIDKALDILKRLELLKAEMSPAMLEELRKATGKES